MRLPQRDRKRLGDNGSKPDEALRIRDQIKAAIAAGSGTAADIVPRRCFAALDHRPAIGCRQPELIEGLKAVHHLALSDDRKIAKRQIAEFTIERRMRNRMTPQALQVPVLPSRNPIAAVQPATKQTRAQERQSQFRP
jgi:hypothetical protein